MYLKISGNFLTKDWTVQDEKLIYGNGQKVYEIERMYDLKFKEPKFGGDGSLEFKYLDSKEPYEFLVYSKHCKEDAKKAFEYLKEHSFDAAAKELEKIEVKMKCNVCGKIYCYTQKDIEENLRNAKRAMVSSVGALANAIGGTQIGYYGSSTETDRALGKIIDYSRCPSCNSSNVSQITEEEFVAVSTKAENSSNNVSAADEILKYKNLLDMGIITEEEFEFKKRELLGL